MTLPAPSYNPHQQLFAEKLTHYPRVIGRKLRSHISSHAWEVVQLWDSSTQAQYGSTLSSSLASISAVAGKPNSESDYPRQAEFESQDPGMSMVF